MSQEATDVAVTSQPASNSSLSLQRSVAPQSVAPQSVAPQADPILFLFLEIFSQEGGIQSYVKDIFRAYTRLEHPPRGDVFLLRDQASCDNEFANGPLTFHYFKSLNPTWGRVRMAIALLFYLVQKRPAQVLCGHILLAPLVQQLCGFLNIPYTVLTYGKEVWQPLAPNAQTALQQATSIWTISRYTGDKLCASNHINADQLRFLPCAIDGDYFTPGEKSVALLERYGLNPDGNILVTVARLWSGDIYKGVDVTLRALPTIQQAIPGAQYLIIGRGDDQPRLAQLAQDLGVADDVVFAGFVPTEELREHYRLADVYVMPSQEGFGIVYLEAMACGIPVISGDADGSADPVQEGRVGWRVPHRDPEAVAQACIEVLQGQDQRCDGVWLRQEAIATFGKQAFQNTLQTLLQP
ncbi:MAG: glycosyltransferase family 4 protein [Cyanothece sp. SIO2G6]|nr:glycosyltransferase family 4 protein [Cyanothece sp. SIO2G6]